MRSKDRVTLTIGLAAMIVAVFALGGGPRWAVVGVGGLAVICAATQVRSRRYLKGVSPLLVFIGVAICLTGLQIIPLPDGVFATLNSTGHGLVVDGQVLLHGKDAADEWRPISVDPAATRLELAKFVMYFLLAWIALRTAASERGRYRLLAATAGLAGVIAVVGIVHELLGADTLFGIYRPTQANPMVMAPLLNPNHLACLMGMGAILAGGLALNERRSPPIRALWITIAIACVGVCIATRSRGGVIALCTGSTITAVVSVLQRFVERESDRKDTLRIAVPAMVIVLCTLILVISFGGSVSRELAKTSFNEFSESRSKFGAMRSALALIEEAPILGVGRGGFESSFSRVHPLSGEVTFSHVENEYLQAVIDWGIAGALALAVAIGFAVLVVFRRWRSGALTAASIGALAAVGAQSLVDFGLELPGIAVPTLVIAATLLYVPLEEARRRRLRVHRYAVLLLAIGTLTLAGSPLSRSLIEDHEEFRDRTPSLEKAEASFDRHPIDYLSAAYVAQTSDPDKRVRFLNHALRLHPTHPGLHRIIAGWLAASGRTTQAAIEYRVALLGSDTPEPLVAEVLARLPIHLVVAALPSEHRLWSQIAKELVERKQPALSLTYLERVAQERPTDVELWNKVFANAELQQNLEVAKRAERRLASLDSRITTTLKLARLELKLLRYDDARATIKGVAADEPVTTEHVEARVLVCEIDSAQQRWEVARTCLNAVQLLAVTLTTRRRIHRELAVVEGALGNTERAAFERSLATERVPSGSASP